MKTDSHGIIAHGAAFLAAAARYSRARLSLAELELREAGARYGLAVAAVVAAIFVAGLGYIFLVITAVFAIAAAFDARLAWLWVMAAVALLHFAIAAGLAALAWARMRAGVLPDTLAELRKDQEWLTQLARKS